MLKNFSKTIKIGVACLALGGLFYACTRPTITEEDRKFQKKLDSYIFKSNFAQMMIDEEAEDLNETNTNKTIMGKNIIDLDHGKIVRSRDYSSKQFVIYIKDVHYQPEIQQNITSIVEEIYEENKIDLLGVEGFCEELTKEYIENSPRAKDPDGLDQIKTYFANLHLELKFGDKLKTWGLEDKELYEKGLTTMLTSMAPVMNAPFNNEEMLKKVFQTVSENRSYMAIEKILQYMDKEREDKAVFIFGGAHTRTLVKKLEESKVSYIIIEPNNYREVTEEYFSKLKSNTTLQLREEFCP